MQNDLSGQIGSSSEPPSIARIAAVSKFMSSREDAEIWAMSGIKFLIYDDLDEKLQGYDSDDEDGMLEYALEMSKAGTEVAQSDNAHGETGSLSERHVDDDKGSSDAGPSIAQSSKHSKASCRVCSSCPEFPHNRKTRKFRLFKPAEMFPELAPDVSSIISPDLICMHYVAVSYCWPVPEFDADGKMIRKEGTYRVRDLDGTLRSNRALDDVLDRAVDVANTFGLRMIWIDQECLPQPTDESPEEDKDEQQLGVQAMDLVYNRAMVTAGLHDGIITSQAQMDALEIMMHIHKTKRAPAQPNGQMMDHVLDFLETTSQDRWYTRAWVVQETLSAGNGTVLVFRRGPCRTYCEKFRPEGGPEARFFPGHSLDLAPRQLPSDCVCIPINEFRGIVKAAQIILQRDFMSFGNQLARFDNRPVSLTERAGPILRAAEKLHPSMAILNSNFQRSRKIYLVGGYNYGFRDTVDAAGALTLLKNRHCRDTQDRIAIVANMCSYDVRLDTRLAFQLGFSLRESVTALALLNGDFSILVPEAYEWPKEKREEEEEQEGVSGWLWPLDRHPDLIDHALVHNYNRNRIYVPPDTSAGGVAVPSYLWKVEEEIDLAPIKYQWAEDWESLKCLRIAVSGLKGETNDQFLRRHRLISEHFAKPSIMSQTRKDLFLKDNPLADDSVVWHELHRIGVSSEGIRVTNDVVAARVLQTPEMQQIISQIFFGILRYLHNSADTDPRARELATSIWQSVRVDYVSEESVQNLPDDVDDELFDHPDVVSRPFDTLQLDITRDDQFAQLWFIDRIMRKGTLYVGRYINPTFQSRDIAGKGHDEPISEEALGNENSEEAASAGDGHETPPTQKPTKGKGTAGVGKTAHSFSKSILQRQLSRQLLANMFSVKVQPKSPGSMSMVTSGTLTCYAEVNARGLWTKEAEEGRMRKLVSTFDVKGPCLVATPFSGMWETLPHAALRSMSSCWIVEATQPEDLDIKEKREGPGDLEKPESSEGKAKGKAREVDMASEEDKRRCYRVVGKVRGLWKLMDPAMQRIDLI